MIELSCNEIEPCEILPPSARAHHVGYKETKVIWLSAGVMVLNNNDVPIDEDIAAALEIIPELVRCAKVDRWVEECAEWMRRRTG